MALQDASVIFTYIVILFFTLFILFVWRRKDRIQGDKVPDSWMKKPLYYILSNFQWIILLVFGVLLVMVIIISVDITSLVGASSDAMSWIIIVIDIVLTGIIGLHFVALISACGLNTFNIVDIMYKDPSVEVVGPPVQNDGAGTLGDLPDN